MPRALHLVVAILVLGSFALLCDATLFQPGTVFTIHENIQIGEAQSWWQGRLDLPERKWDSALCDGKVYSHFPPMFSFLSALVAPFFGGVPHWFVLVVVVVPIPILAYSVMRRVIPHSFEIKEVRGWGAFLALGLVCGTSALPVMEKALRGAGPYFVNHALAMTGLLLFLSEYFGRQRWWVAGAGVVLAAWSRQMTMAYLLPFTWMVLRSTAPARAEPSGDGADQGLHCAPPLATNLGPIRGRPSSPELQQKQRFKARRVVCALAIGVMALGVPMGLNWLKFGSPLDSGYMYIYAGREEDVLARDAREHGLFSWHFVPRNLYYSNLGFWTVQSIDRAGKLEWYLTPQLWGTGIWWTTPLLLFAVWDWRTILRDPRRRMLLAAAALAYIGLMFFHATGYKQRGFNRFSLDYLPALFALAAPATMMTRRRRLIGVAMIAWGLGYFAFMRHVPNIRIW